MQSKGEEFSGWNDFQILFLGTGSTLRINKNHLPLPPLRSRKSTEEIADSKRLGVQPERRGKVEFRPEGAGQGGESSIGVHIDDSPRNDRIHGTLGSGRGTIRFGLEDGFLVGSCGCWVFVFWRERLAVLGRCGRFGSYWVPWVIVRARPGPGMREWVLAVEQVTGIRSKYVIQTA